MINEPDLVQIAFDSLQPLQHLVDEIAIDKPEDHRFNERTIIIVSLEPDSENRENDYAKTEYWYSTVEVIVCGPDRDNCRELCKQAHDLILAALEELQTQDERILGLARGIKSIGAATFGGIFIDGYCARRTIEIHNSFEY
jgi:hypothetical protein